MMVQAPARTLVAAMISGPRYLVSMWPWRALLWTVFGGVLGTVLIVGLPLILVMGVSRSARTAVWAPLLEIECARLSLIDEAAAERARSDVNAARAQQRLPTLRQAGYMVLTAMFTGPWGVVLVGFSAILIGVMVAAPWLVRPGEPINVGLWLIDSSGEAWAAVTLGIALLVLAAYLVGAYAAAVAQITVAALVDPHALQREVARLEHSRTALLDAVEQERRRIESDLHDRVQHRLVALALTLGIAENAHGDSAAGRLAADAHGQVDDIAAELRSVLLGILPRALTEHGLVAAATDLIGRYPVAVEADFGATEIPARLPGPVEHTAYLVLNEALTNSAKHASAGHVTITADRRDGLWWLVIRDDGRGGATIQPGRGLATLAARVEAVNGTLTVTSPAGGPTEVGMRCPV
ncbi:sensor histidine kinase [Mycolicibacterium sp. PAM1]|uniref:histidine kinase n=3 Tax=Mycobacteriaceae TaxID=1762 RepID=A0A378SU52_9MYCO|nr:integral membrane sensor signal transduction histidine kinase [Mycolicibacterium gilvum PYR-GCK]MBV5242294.1 sensor histidine kinase [Mycolicibacterium sp. PAM1]MCV7054067.1 sensor histidine kinase [Mycolicibacterium gilvum]STZ46332.1 integral membrane sensor signal transduction histidine kinase [Mycolicibacterium gilvum]